MQSRMDEKTSAATRESWPGDNILSPPATDPPSINASPIDIGTSYRVKNAGYITKVA